MDGKIEPKNDGILVGSKEGYTRGMSGTSQSELITDLFSAVDLGINLQEYRDKKKEISESIATPTFNRLGNGESLDLSFRLGDTTGRVLVYPRTPDDDKAYQQLRDARVPQFDRILYFRNPDLTVVQVPTAAYRLDSIVYNEDRKTHGAYTGAMEIMEQLGAVLKKAKRATGMLPRNFRLGKAAFITGEKDFIKLIPPYHGSPTSTSFEITEAIRIQLDIIDPDHDHKAQVAILQKTLRGI